MGDAFFLAIANNFTSEVNMRITRVAGIACSVADIAFIFILLKTAYFLRGPDAPRPRKRLFALGIFALLTPTLALPVDTDGFMIWQSFVLGVPYLILAYSIVAELPVLLRHLREHILPKLRKQ